MSNIFYMDVKFRIVKDWNLLIQKYTGVFSYDPYFEHIKRVTNDPDWKYVDKIITDLRNIDLEMFYKNMDYLIKYRNENIKKNYYNIFIVDAPLSTAIMHLYKKKLNSLRYKYEYCSTLEFALAELKMEDKKEKIKSILENM